MKAVLNYMLKDLHKYMVQSVIFAIMATIVIHYFHKEEAKILGGPIKQARNVGIFLFFTYSYLLALVTFFNRGGILW